MDDIYLKKVTAGDTEAFRYFVNTYSQMAFTVAFGIVQNESLAEDIVQDAFMKAYKNIKRFRGEAKFSTWFYKIVSNTAFKKVKSRKAFYSFNEDIGADTVNDIEYHATDDLKAEEQKKYINMALDQMTPRESSVLKLFYLEELTLKEIGEVFNLSVEHTKVILYRARKQFYKVLEKELKHELSSIL